MFAGKWVIIQMVNITLLRLQGESAEAQACEKQCAIARMRNYVA